MQSKDERLMDFWSGSAKTALLVSMERVIARGGKM